MAKYKEIVKDYSESMSRTLNIFASTLDDLTESYDRAKHLMAAFALVYGEIEIEREKLDAVSGKLIHLHLVADDKVMRIKVSLSEPEEK